MESFLASRPTIAKLGSTQKNLSGAGAFTPLMEKKADAMIVPPPNTTTTSASGAASAAPPPETAVEKPHVHTVSVELVREDGVVQGLVVTCKCGERIELDCVY